MRFVVATGRSSSTLRDRKLKVYCQPSLLIIDESSDIPIERLGANLFVQLNSRRYEKGAMIMTSNEPFSNCAEFFGDQVIASVILPRVLHHALPA